MLRALDRPLLTLALAALLGAPMLAACRSDSPPASAAAASACGSGSGGIPPSQAGKIDIGGFSLYADVQGTYAPGQPTVVFDSGAGEAHGVWQTANVQQAIAQSHLTVSYDRAGLGQSDESNLPKTGAEQARQLRLLLQNSALPPPYLLVSHSVAGFNARLFADLYPDDVYGVVFVDSSHEGINQGTWQPITIVDVTTTGEMSYLEFSETVQQAQDSRAADRLRHKPISVLSATCHGPCQGGVSIVDESGWMEFQADLAALSDDSVHTVAPPGSEHHLMTTQPQMVIDGVCEILGR